MFSNNSVWILNGCTFWRYFVHAAWFDVYVWNYIVIIVTGSFVTQTVLLIGVSWMKKKLLKMLLFINVLVGLIIVWVVGSGLYQTITVPDNFDYVSALLLGISGVPCLLANVVFSLVLYKFIKKQKKTQKNDSSISSFDTWFKIFIK